MCGVDGSQLHWKCLSSFRLHVWLLVNPTWHPQADELEARTESRRTSASMGLDAGHGGPARSRGPSYAGEQQQQQPAASSPHLSPLGPPTPTPSPAQPAGPVSDDVAVSAGVRVMGA